MHENLPVALSSSGSVTTGLEFESSTSFEEFSLSSATVVFPVLQVKSSQQGGMPSLFKELVKIIIIIIIIIKSLFPEGNRS